MARRRRVVPSTLGGTDDRSSHGAEDRPGASPPDPRREEPGLPEVPPPGPGDRDRADDPAADLLDHAQHDVVLLVSALAAAEGDPV